MSTEVIGSLELNGANSDHNSMGVMLRSACYSALERIKPCRTTQR